MPTCAEGRITMMFSATFPRPIQRLASDFMINPVEVKIGRVGAASQLTTQKVLYVEERDKFDALCDMVSEHPGLTLVFVETKRNADMLEHRLCDCGYASADLVPVLTGRVLRKFLLPGLTLPDCLAATRRPRSTVTGRKASAKQHYGRSRTAAHRYSARTLVWLVSLARGMASCSADRAVDRSSWRPTWRREAWT